MSRMPFVPFPPSLKVENETLDGKFHFLLFQYIYFLNYLYFTVSTQPTKIIDPIINNYYQAKVCQESQETHQLFCWGCGGKAEGQKVHTEPAIFEVWLGSDVNWLRNSRCGWGWQDKLNWSGAWSELGKNQMPIEKTSQIFPVRCGGGWIIFWTHFAGPALFKNFGLIICDFS